MHCIWSSSQGHCTLTKNINRSKRYQFTLLKVRVQSVAFPELCWCLKLRYEQSQYIALVGRLNFDLIRSAINLLKLFSQIGSIQTYILSLFPKIGHIRFDSNFWYLCIFILMKQWRIFFIKNVYDVFWLKKSDIDLLVQLFFLGMLSREVGKRPLTWLFTWILKLDLCVSFETNFSFLRPLLWIFLFYYILNPKFDEVIIFWFCSYAIQTVQQVIPTH